MTEEQRRKLQDLKSINKKYVEQLEWNGNVLLQECLNVLGNYTIVTDGNEIVRIRCIANTTNVLQLSHFDKPALVPNHIYYVVWDNAQVPFIECTGTCIMAHWDDVLAVAFDTLFIDKNEHTAILIRR